MIQHFVRNTNKLTTLRNKHDSSAVITNRLTSVPVADLGFCYLGGGAHIIIRFETFFKIYLPDIPNSTNIGR